MTTVATSYIEIVEEYGKIKRRIGGKQITVDEIVRMHVIGESPLEWIVENFPLTLGQIYAALSYYYDHQAEIDAAIRAEDEEFERLAAEQGDKLAELRARAQQKKESKD
ncbi:MAG: DUF433 domain-containing protein [Anaerolineae bacterium]|nr:DUF433 domain-containing protein [Anaerolineae bacterium]